MTVVTFKNRSFLISYKKIGVVNGFPNDKSDSSPHYHFKFFVKDVDDAVDSLYWLYRMIPANQSGRAIMGAFED